MLCLSRNAIYAFLNYVSNLMIHKIYVTYLSAELFLGNSQFAIS